MGTQGDLCILALWQEGRPAEVSPDQIGKILIRRDNFVLTLQFNNIRTHCFISCDWQLSSSIPIKIIQLILNEYNGPRQGFFKCKGNPVSLSIPVHFLTNSGRKMKMGVNPNGSYKKFRLKNQKHIAKQKVMGQVNSLGTFPTTVQNRFQQLVLTLLISFEHRL